MAGLVRTPFLLFLRYDFVGSMLWAGVGLGIGAPFNHAVDRVLTTMAQYGRIGLLIGVMALVLFIGWSCGRESASCGVRAGCRESPRGNYRN